ncbi:C4-dicarboxylate ABC transporter substrate-binding protein [Salinadaptatus halalkaliphilus]|uniref:C4-dicarboxylate ABC transporter substrate-binding protein n=2 Tax=Salinadaptatus halalkaliphilus TaxID=2419781 RepID=A0A4V3VLK3_9EURY|nr:C4-dicarboxylate ABC transporter substrate-binding protein [Salinadaptatus halalkaliphilus]
MVNKGRRVSRRTYMTVAGASVIGLAGCAGEEDPNGDTGGTDIGNGDDSAGNGDGPEEGDEELIWTCTSESSSTTISIQGIAPVVNDATEGIYMEGRPSEGTGANMGRLDRDEAQVAYTQNFDATRVPHEMEPFHDLDFELNEVMHWLTTPWLFITPHEELDSIADIEPDHRVSATQTGAGTRDNLEMALDYVIDDYDDVSVDFTQQSGPFQEGSLDVGVVPIMNFEIEGAYAEEQKSIVDLHVLEWPDDAVAELEDDPLVEMMEIDAGDLEGYASVPDQQPMMTPGNAYNFVTRNDVDYDVLYDTLHAMWDHRDEYGDIHALMTYHQDAEHWTDFPYPEVPYHPAAADFLEDIGAWDGAEGGRADE